MDKIKRELICANKNKRKWRANFIKENYNNVKEMDY